ncbi:hypothetical protein [Garciella nitratireducens]|uniref:hypothetical protein n=1 Tax=Garciella nitratireducens TaxID=218205 RepID=UPI000DEA39D0|nr:hypothetical protein [Garciella nitratireducens]RBP42759.1 hypothetical protein DFR81_10876 [Garciella nitratireducens]
MKKISTVKNFSMIFLVSALIIFTVSMLGKYLIFTQPNIIHISNIQGSSDIKIISQKVSLLLFFNSILEKIGLLFLLLSLISTSIYVYQKYYNE